MGLENVSKIYRDRAGRRPAEVAAEAEAPKPAKKAASKKTAEKKKA